MKGRALLREKREKVEATTKSKEESSPALHTPKDVRWERGESASTWKDSRRKWVSYFGNGKEVRTLRDEGCVGAGSGERGWPGDAEAVRERASKGRRAAP